MNDDINIKKRNFLASFLLDKNLVKDEVVANNVVALILIVVIALGLFISYGVINPSVEVDTRDYSELSPVEKAQIPAEFRPENQ